MSVRSRFCFGTSALPAALALTLGLPSVWSAESGQPPVIEEPAPASAEQAPAADPVTETWGIDDHSWPIQARANGGVTVTTDIGPINVDSDLAQNVTADTAETLAHLVQLAAASGLNAEEEKMRYGQSILAGKRLRGSQHVVIHEGVLVKDPEAVADHSAQLNDVSTALESILGTIEESSLDRLVKRTLDHVLRRSAEKATGDYEGDEVTPTYARRVIRHGWLDRVLTDQLSGEIYAQKITEATQLAPAIAYRGENIELDHLTDAFGDGGWFISTPERVRLALSPRIPFYHWSSQPMLSQAILVIDLPAGTDPRTDDLSQATAVRLYHDDKLLVWWSDEKGFGANEVNWRQVAPANRGLDANIARGYLPPHLVVTDMRGDIHNIITAHGIIEPPADRTAEAGEAFLAQAATVLPDAPHLDLIGQYLFQYTYDSPDSASPLLIGTDEVSGDIHQTALETLSTTTGGQCRGDCDDLSELYQEILGQQGKTAHVISLPAHAAVAWAEQREDNWHVFVMQTGATLEFVDPKLQTALSQAYKRFDAADTFDPNGLGLLLRFSGENTRSSWRLSYRIFSEPEYARTMIDVQRDWHYQTYMQGIKKMEQLIADGDEDTANYREMAGLFSFTAQHEKAAEYLELAILRTQEADSRLFESSELAHHYLEAGNQQRVQEVVLDILDNQLPALAGQLGPATAQFGMQLAGYLISGDEPLLAARVLNETANDTISDTGPSLQQYIEQAFDERQWNGHPQLLQMRRMLSWHASVAANILLSVDDPSTFATDPALQRAASLNQHWVDHIALRDVDDEAEVLLKYDDIGRFYEGLLGSDAFTKLLLAADAPAEGPHLHHERVGGIAQLRLDLPWIKISPAYWANRLSWMLNNDSDFDRDELTIVTEHFYAAIAAAEARDLHSALLDRVIHNGQVTAAVLNEDEDALRELMIKVRNKNDKRLRDATAGTIGDCANIVSAAWFTRMLELWQSELDYKPKYYWIAWRAAHAGAHDRALQVAKLAAERFPNDPAFVEEYEFMQALFHTDDASE